MNFQLLADLICIINNYAYANCWIPLGNGAVRIIDRENLGEDTTIFHLSCIIIEI